MDIKLIAKLLVVKTQAKNNSTDGKGVPHHLSTEINKPSLGHQRRKCGSLTSSDGATPGLLGSLFSRRTLVTEEDSFWPSMLH
jgi:hypothetical protein